MRTLLAIFITLGLMLNSGSGFAAAAFAKASLAEGKRPCAPDGVSPDDARAQQGGGGLPQAHFEIPSARMQMLRSKHKMHA
jgi:hypothetical protein